MVCSCARTANGGTLPKVDSSQDLSEPFVVNLAQQVSFMDKKRLFGLGPYRLKATIGKGSFARVYHGEHTQINAQVAVKVLNLRETSLRLARREATVQAHLRHPNIASFFEALQGGHLFFGLVSEFAGGGTLLSHLHKFPNKKFPEPLARIYTRQLVSALEYMRYRGVAHRDIKMQNILLQANLIHVKICDFGLSGCFGRNLDGGMGIACGSPEYAAPEVLEASSDFYGVEVDIWSLGIVLFQMVIGRLPFRSPYHDHRWRQRLTRYAKEGLGKRHNQLLKTISSECSDFLKASIEPERNKRIKIESVLCHPWLTANNLLPFEVFRSDEYQAEEDAVSLTSTESSVPKFQNTRSKTMIKIMSKELSLTENDLRVQLNNKPRGGDLPGIFLIRLEQQRISEGFYELDHTSPSWPMIRVSITKSFQCNQPQLPD